MSIVEWGASAKELTQLLAYFPNLSELNLWDCDKILWLGVAEKRAKTTPVPPSSAVKADGAQILQHQQQQDGTRGEEEIAAEGLLLLPPQLQKLDIHRCWELSLRSNPVDHNTEAGRTGGGQGLQDLTIWECRDLRVEGLRPLLAQGRLTNLKVSGTPNFFAGFEELPSSSTKLQELVTDDVTGALAAPTCAMLSPSLTELDFWGDKEVERFTKEQEEALQLLTSLERIRFCKCDKLQCLPAGLHGLPNLKRLHIFNCAAIRSLPKDGLPSSLQELEINSCPAIRSVPKECLPSSLQKLEIISCPAIRSLPKVDDLPSSLRELNVRGSKSEELTRHCRKVVGTIPIVRA
ncbi:disease resistance protein RGA2-like [Panicum miliaceum]|uniref:Disease resistance protein RGA2-like n=1 Tax=Panicum miliaceum TaxID=4540 RepID=A0A3L6QCC9_PANMI|nr:disease resistance protein RGA2-like [Panicum miliaceum]